MTDFFKVLLRHNLDIL